MMNLAKQRVAVFVLLTVLRFGATEGDSNLCAHRDVRPSSTARTSSSSSSSAKSSSDDLFRNWGGEVQDDNLTIRCHSNIYCFTLWTSDAHNKSKVNVLKQGCWIGEPNVCMQGSCVSSMAPKNNSHFCCCSGDMCNLNFTDGYDPTAHTTTPFIPSRPLQDHSYKIKTVIISLVSVFSVALVIIVAYFGYRMCTRPKHPSIESLHAPESPPVQPEFDMDDLKLCSIISKGRYAEVWRGKLEDRDVAVKIYSSHYREYYNNERTLYRLPFMDFEGLVRFYGADERITQDGSAQLMIVMSYVPLGSLNSYLKNNTLDWPTMVRMAYSVAKALSHLHTDIQKGDLSKPVLAHRDLNTRNILVRSDFTCIIADLGFAIATVGSKLIKRGHAEIAEQTSLTDVGTLRYMAPELLDGAVNLRDCEASLKQIDMYALGLVLWEISSRCIDLYQGAPLPEYAPPFQAEVGSSPTFEEMQMLVVRAKKRPKFPEVWKETNQAVRSLKETIEECWDADAEARLTALCVEERLSDLPNLWAHEIKHRGMTPTLNAMININETTTATTTENPLMSAPSELPPARDGHNMDSDDTTAPLLSNGHLRNGQSSRSPSVSASRSWLQPENSMSTGTTDTILPITPVDGSSVPLKASNLIQERNSTVLRPHTGRNPTVERNTHKRSDEELRVSGNTLISSAFPARRDSLSTQSAPPEQPTADSPPDYMSDGPETSLVQNDALSHRNPPIPYVQNQVHGDLPAGRPKVANTTSLRGYGRGERSFREKLSRLIRPKELGLKLSSFSLFGGGRRHDYSRAQDMEVEDFQQEQTNVAGHPQNAATRPVSNLGPGQPASRHSNLRPIHTEVQLQNGSAVTRPTNLVLSDQRCLRETAGRGSGSGTRDSAREESSARDSSREGSSARDCGREGSSSRSSTREGSTLSRELGAADAAMSREETVRKGSQSDSVDEVFTDTAQAQSAAVGQPGRYPENRLRFAEVGVAKLHIPAISQQPVRRLQGHSKSTSELLHLHRRNHNSDSCWQETELSAPGEDHTQRRRPNSLSLKGHNYSALKPLLGKRPSKTETAGSNKPSSKHKLSAAPESSAPKLKGSDRGPAKRGSSAAPAPATKTEGGGVKGGRAPPTSLLKLDKTDDSGEKIRRRVKTPVRPTKKNARLSLYDDRLMSSESSGAAEGKTADAALRKSLTSSKLASNNNNNNNTESVKGVKDDPSASAVSAQEGLPSQHALGEGAICISDSSVVV